MKKTEQAWQRSEKISFTGLAIYAIGLNCAITALLSGGGLGVSKALDIFTIAMAVAGFAGLLMMAIPVIRVVRNELEPRFDKIGKPVKAPDRLLYGLVSTAASCLAAIVFVNCKPGETIRNILMISSAQIIILAVPFIFAFYFAHKYNTSLWEGFSLAIYKSFSGAIGIHIVLSCLAFKALFSVLNVLCIGYELDRERYDYLRRNAWWMY